MGTVEMPFTPSRGKEDKGDPAASSGSRTSVPGATARAAGNPVPWFRRGSARTQRTPSASSWRGEAAPGSVPPPRPGYYLDRATVASLPAQVSPTVPAEYQNALWRPEAGQVRGGGPVTHRNQVAGGVSGGPEQPTLFPRSLPTSLRIPFLQNGDQSEADEWETVTSGLGSSAAAEVGSAAGGARYHPRYRPAGSSLADNSSVGGLTLPDRARLHATRRLPPSSPTPAAASSSSRSYAHPQGQPSQHPLANVPRLGYGEVAAVGGSFVTTPGTGTMPARSNPWAVSHDSIAMSSPGQISAHSSNTHLVGVSTPRPRNRHSPTGDFWDDITHQLHRPQQASHNAHVNPRRSRYEWARNVQRAIARRSEIPFDSGTNGDSSDASNSSGNDSNASENPPWRSADARRLESPVRLLTAAPRPIEQRIDRNSRRFPVNSSDQAHNVALPYHHLRAPRTPEAAHVSSDQHRMLFSPPSTTDSFAPQEIRRQTLWPSRQPLPRSTPLNAQGPAQTVTSRSIHRGYEQFEIDDSPHRFDWANSRARRGITCAGMHARRRVSYRVLLLWAILASIVTLGLAIALAMILTTGKKPA